MTDQPDIRGFALGQLSASAIAYGAKQIETRKWAPSEKYFGQRIAILASKAMPRGGRYGLERWMLEEQNIPWLVEAGYVQMNEELEWEADVDALPRGAFICTATLTMCVPTEDLADLVSDLEWSHGDYTPGRFGWLLDEVYRLSQPVPYLGALGLFKIEPYKDCPDPLGRIVKAEIREPVPAVPSTTTPDRSGLLARTF